MNKIIVCSGNTVGVVGVPKEIKILPLGLVHSQKGDFRVDDESVELIRQQFKDRKLDLVIDYEHQTLKDIQAYCKQQVNTLWDEIKRFDNPQTYYVDLSQKLWDIQQELLRKNRN